MHRSNCSLFVVLILLTRLGSASSGYSQSHGIHQSGPLRTVAAAAEREIDHAAYGQPVNLRAQVTFVDPEWRLLFVRDATGSIFVQLPPKITPLKAGALVQLTGTTASGDVGTNIEHPKIRTIRNQPLAGARALSLAAIEAGLADSQYVMTDGVIRPGPFVWNHTWLTLVDGTDSTPIIIPGGVNPSAQALVGAHVRVRGVSAVRMDEAQRPIGYQLFVQSLEDIRPEDSNWQDLFNTAAVPVAHIWECNLSGRFLTAYHVRGKVLWKGIGSLVITDRSGSVEIHTLDDSAVVRGAVVDVIGFPGLDHDVVVLDDARIRVVGSESAVAGIPARLSPAQALQSGRDGDVVHMSGKVSSESASGSNHRVLINDDGKQFEILVSAQQEAGGFVTLAPGATLEAFGTLRRIHHRGRHADTIQLLLNSPKDIVLRTNSVNWRALAAALIVISVLSVLAWNVQLRRALRAKMTLLRMQLEHDARLENRCRRLVERNLAAVFSWRPSGEITHCNQAFAHMLGHPSPEDVIGQSYWCLLSSDARMSLAGPLEAGTVNGFESTVLRPDGTTLHLLENITRVDDELDTYFESTALDITQSKLDRLELQRARDAAQREAELDALTGLPNRRRFTELVKQSIKAGANGAPVALLYLDLDGFKEVNDTHGHVVGDLLLEHVASRLREILCRGDELFRLGGDEFAVLLNRADSICDSSKVAGQLLAALQSPFRIGGQNLKVSGSIGISRFPDPAPDYTSLLQQADSAMYVAKRAGRSRVAVYTDDIGQSVRERSQILAELDGAIERNEISLHYQPQFDTSAQHIIRFEALARWNNRSLGNVSPGKFIPIAEESGLILELGAHILETACKQAVQWVQRTGQGIPVAVNVSTVQFCSHSFSNQVLGILSRTGLPPSLLELEMTESIMLEDLVNCREVLTHLRAAGVGLALDDFGTGYSSLSYLPELPFDRLKIARSVLEKVHRGRGGAALIQSVVSVAHNLDMSVVVEGVETERELKFIRSVGADGVQGFLLGRPGPDPCSVIGSNMAAARLTEQVVDVSGKSISLPHAISAQP
jgi:diguanylate cyclase (GGDEF)-like protein/PAS domain S-box-containing protein